MFEDKNDSQLVDIIRTGGLQADPAFKEIYGRYHKRIFKLIHNSVDNIDDCLDLFQETFLNAYKGLDTYDPKYRFSTWIYRIAINAVLNHKRFKARFFRFMGEYKKEQTGVYTPDYVEALYREKVMDDLHRAIQKLPVKLKLPLLLSTVNELETREIGKIFKISESAVRKRLTEAKKQLKGIMEKKRGV